MKKEHVHRAPALYTPRQAPLRTDHAELRALLRGAIKFTDALMAEVFLYSHLDLEAGVRNGVKPQ